MQRVSKLLEETSGLSKRAIRGGVKGKGVAVDLALETLIAEEHVRVESHGTTRHHFSVRPFRHDEESDT